MYRHHLEKLVRTTLDEIVVSEGVLDRARINKGTLIASGFIAGGALAGVLDGFIKFGTDGETLYSFGNDGGAGNLLGLFVFVAVGVFLWWDARRATEAEGQGPQISL